MEELFDKMFYRALKRKATDIHLVLKEQLSIRFRIFGDLKKYEDIDKVIGRKLMNYIKYKSSINTNYKLLPQTGDFSVIVHTIERRSRRQPPAPAVLCRQCPAREMQVQLPATKTAEHRHIVASYPAAIAPVRRQTNAQGCQAGLPQTARPVQVPCRDRFATV